MTQPPNAIDLTKLADMEAAIEQRKQAAEAKAIDRKREEAAAGVSRAALNMRKRRQRPDIAESERKAIQARNTAQRELAKKHPDEFMVLMQDERKKLGLPPLQPRGKSRTRHEQALHDKQEGHTPMRPAPVSVQQKCRCGDYPVNKQPYGNFCSNCGRRL